jgi:hypothetical protein
VGAAGVQALCAGADTLLLSYMHCPTHVVMLLHCREVCKALQACRPSAVVFTTVPIAGSHHRAAPPGGHNCQQTRKVAAEAAWVSGDSSVAAFTGQHPKLCTLPSSSWSSMGSAVLCNVFGCFDLVLMLDRHHRAAPPGKHT